MTTQFLSHSQGQIAYEEIAPADATHAGGPLVICVPGMGDVRAEYRFLAPRLASAGLRVVTMDVRGHGESSTSWPDFSVAAIGSDILALIQHLGGGPAVIVGTSMAAGAAVWAAAEAPELVRALVMIGPFVRGGGDLLGKLLAGAFFARPWGAPLWAKYYTSLYPTRLPDDFDAYRTALQHNLTQPGRLEALQSMLRASKDAAEERLGRVKAPALIVMGSKDPDFKPPEAEAQWVAERVSGSVHMIAGAGHYPHVEMPDLTAPPILDFLKTLQPAEVAHVG
jgi:pimeloyl-ACP methyl ester carboxylesterase